jgi:hypothetical protein
MEKKRKDEEKKTAALERAKEQRLLVAKHLDGALDECIRVSNPI